jgi:hypothetical protein
MAFVNEEISKEDYDKYDIGQFVKRFGSISPNSDWTIDRDRDIWFRLYHERCDREEDLGAELWTSWGFYWKGVFITLDTKFLERKFTNSIGKFYVYAKILDIDIPQEAEQYKQEILKDLKEAFEASNAGNGIHSRANGYRVDLEYEGKLV